MDVLSASVEWAGPAFSVCFEPDILLTWQQSFRPLINFCHVVISRGILLEYTTNEKAPHYFRQGRTITLSDKV